MVKKNRNSDDEYHIDNENKIHEKIEEMNDLVTSKGEKLNNSEITSSDIIIPNQDLALTDLKKIFKEEGLIPDS